MFRIALVAVAAAMLTGAALAATGDPVKRHTAADMAKDSVSPTPVSSAPSRSNSGRLSVWSGQAG